MLPTQPPLFPAEQTRLFNVPFPTTRYQGSKRKLTEWIWANVEHLTFDSVLDVFGGTGAVSHLFKRAGKQVIYNDYLSFNQIIGRALIENTETLLTDASLNQLLSFSDQANYPDFIQRTFAGIYFTDEENRWLDQAAYHISALGDPYAQAIAWFALFQSCIVKRPYNLFHRANLYMRLAEVQRSFGNKATWDTAFETHFRAFVREANAAVFDNGRENRVLNLDAMETPTGVDLVYIDPPYLSKAGVGVDYLDFYHFLEGLTNYTHWPENIDYHSKHKRFIRRPSAWTRADEISGAFEGLIARHRHSILVVSYRDDGIPSKNTLIDLLRGYKQDVREAQKSQKYALALKNSKELLLIAT